jgi:hypothetical protein
MAQKQEKTMAQKTRRKKTKVPESTLKFRFPGSGSQVFGEKKIKAAVPLFSPGVLVRFSHPKFRFKRFL